MMKKILFSLSLLGSLGIGAAAASAADLAAPMAPPPPAPLGLAGGLFPPVVVQFGPTTPYSTIDCANFAKQPDGTWLAITPVKFGLGFVQGIVPPLRPIKSGAFIYNNIDLYSQLEAQCAGGMVVRARY